LFDAGDTRFSKVTGSAAGNARVAQARKTAPSSHGVVFIGFHSFDAVINDSRLL
jgi:hypothetical protein